MNQDQSFLDRKIKKRKLMQTILKQKALHHTLQTIKNYIN